jgi:hypothetical protein
VESLEGVTELCSSRRSSTTDGCRAYITAVCHEGWSSVQQPGEGVYESTIQRARVRTDVADVPAWCVDEEVCRKQ